tara:strand:+ start:1433 stop:1897 length:465 start_codon:yes stop_codon:yes gene_type:complete
MKLSKNFSLKELTRSGTALRLGIDNSPNDEQLVGLTALCCCILQPVREKFGRVMINSGLRVLDLNRAIKSGDNSQHVFGQAADFEAPAVSNYELACWVRDNLDYDQLILEFYTAGDPTSGWVHCSYRADGGNRKDTKTASRKEGKVVYEDGLLE